MAARTTIPVAMALSFSSSSMAAVLRPSREQQVKTEYTFAQFSSDFDRSYAVGSEEYAHRATLFEQALLDIKKRNARNAQEGRLWKAGIHPFMDWAHHERLTLNGYKPSRDKARTGFIQNSAHGRSNATRGAFDDTDLADTVSGGLSAGDGPQMRNQGNCGSCWAISAAEALEAQLQRNGLADKSTRVSAQALVDCVPNPQHCGGSGGCDGATGELAYAFVRDYGIPLEKDLPYTAQTQQCPENPLSGAYPAMTRVRASGWNALPSNQAKPLMQALVSQGPAVVAVDGNNWFDYEKGVFDSCDKDAIIGHAVLATGFGQDNGNNYWQIQNSWGQQWGEEGHIRLLKRDDDDTWCGTDRKPKEGLGCDGGPSEVKVCGTCGVLFDSLVPQGVRMESQ